MAHRRAGAVTVREGRARVLSSVSEDSAQRAEELDVGCARSTIKNWSGTRVPSYGTVMHTVSVDITTPAHVAHVPYIRVCSGRLQ